MTLAVPALPRRPAPAAPCADRSRCQTVAFRKPYAFQTPEKGA